MKFEATFDSLRTYRCPNWFRDAKFGIWSHWGPQSVPMCGDWYARNMYIQGTPQYLYHLRHYGHPSEFGYKDLCRLWKAEAFEPERLMELYYQAGARYFVAQATHHDNFFNYDSKCNRFNSVQIGPHRDICRMWKQAAKQYGMRFGLTEHLAASFSWWYVNKGADTYGPRAGVPYDGNDPEYRDFYHANGRYLGRQPHGEMAPWLTEDPAFQQYWLDSVKEMIDLFHPDLLYSDSSLPFEAAGYEKGLEAVAYLYNDAIRQNGSQTAVYTQKCREEEIYRVGTLDVEKSQLAGISPDPWQTDTCIGNWFYDAKQEYKRPEQLIEMLIDIVSKNGTMLLNILQRPDGSIDEEAEYILRELAAWNRVCGEGIYGTRPWKQFGEGDTRVIINGFQEDRADWNESDFRFTQREQVLYVFMMKAPESGTAVLKSLGQETVSQVRLLGYGPVPFSWSYGVLTVKLPEQLPTKYTNCLAVTLG